MKLIFKMESVLITIISILCSILLLKLLFKLRSTVPWRVNCWFCNNHFWVKFHERNAWTCPTCEQYNGFTKDGDYNKPIFAANDQALQSPRVFQSTPPKNGLCKMCNINQQLKVMQLANFIPMNDKHFDEEIESYKMQLEKAYKLCSPCRKVLQIKLHKEKESLLGTKLLETRSPEKRKQKDTQSPKLKSFINSTSMFLAGILLVLVSFECYRNIMRNNHFSNTITNVKGILSGLIERVASIIKMKTLLTFPSLENYVNDLNNVFYLHENAKHFLFRMKSLDHVNVLTQKSLGGFACSLQIIGHIWNINKLTSSIVIDLLWSVFVITSIAHDSVTIEPTIMSFVKLTSTLAVMLVYRNIKAKTMKLAARVPTTPKRMKHFNNSTVTSSLLDKDNTLALDTDDDVSLSKFGLRNYSDSSNETVSPLNNSLKNGRTFSPRNVDGMWTKPKLNSTFCVNSVLKSPSSVSDTVFIKPSFNKYQNLVKSDSDSELDESISTLCISSPKKSKRKTDSIFSLRKFTATPSFVAPMPLNRRPLISPSKLGHSTSWVAGGYWGSEGERHISSVNGSRSSSQSSGFESQASSANQRNLFSQPSSREESVCGDHDRPATMLDRFQNTNSHYGSSQPPQKFSRVSSPVFPTMQYNGHVHIPQPRFAQQTGVNPFTQHQYVQSDMFKIPGASGLIRLPQVNSFASR